MMVRNADNLGALPAEVDNDTVIFSYGSLLDRDRLKHLLRDRGTFQIFETDSLAETSKLVTDKPTDIVILRNVRLLNVRVSIVTESMLRRWYAEKGGDLPSLVEECVTTELPSQSIFLVARAASDENGRSLKGGLICNLRPKELLHIDRYEWKPVLERTRTPKLEIDGKTYEPKHVTFYAGKQPLDDISVEERAERSRLMDLNRGKGQKSPQAEWPDNVRQ